jgi:hypothetical protein
VTLTIERLKELLCYCQETGEFTWRINRGARGRKGMPAGCLFTDRSGTQYLRIKIDRIPYPAHRLAWFYVHGYMPDRLIDHRDGKGLNNAINNLREANRLQNARNRKTPRNNTSGFKGVSWHELDQRYRAQISINGRPRHLGNFKTAEEAHAAYCEAAKEHYGEFARAA